ncbi:hypothetical protein Emed_005480 [Eimeria media]
MRDQLALLSLALLVGLVSFPLGTVSSSVAGPSLSPSLPYHHMLMLQQQQQPQQQQQQQQMLSTMTETSDLVKVSGVSPQNWRLRRRRSPPLLLAATVLAASLAISLLVLQCYRFLSSKTAPAAAAAGRRLARDDPLERCERGDGDGGDSEGDGEPRRPSGFVSRFGQALSRLVHGRRPPPPRRDSDNLREVVVHTPPAAPVIPPLASPDIMLRLGEEHLATATVMLGLLLMTAPSSTTLSLVLFSGVVAGLYLLGLEETVAGVTGGRLSIVERSLGRLLTRRPQPPNSETPAGLIFRFGYFFTLAGIHAMVGGISAGVTTAAGLLQFLGGVFELLSGLDEMIYGLSNGYINIAWHFLPRRARVLQPPADASSDTSSDTSSLRAVLAATSNVQQQQQQQQEGAVGGLGIEGDTTSGSGEGEEEETTAGDSNGLGFLKETQV